jgi:hypothetical protein
MVMNCTILRPPATLVYSMPMGQDYLQPHIPLLSYESNDLHFFLAVAQEPNYNSQVAETKQLQLACYTSLSYVIILPYKA